MEDQGPVHFGLPSTDKCVLLSTLKLALKIFQAAIRNYIVTHQHIKRQIYQQQYHTLLPVVDFLSETDQPFIFDVNQDTGEILFQCADIYMSRSPGSELIVKRINPDGVTLLLDYYELTQLVDDLYIDQLEEFESAVKII